MGKWKSPLGHLGTFGLGEREGEVILFKYYSSVVMVTLVAEKRVRDGEEMKIIEKSYLQNVLSLSSYDGISGTRQHSKHWLSVSAPVVIHEFYISRTAVKRTYSPSFKPYHASATIIQTEQLRLFYPRSAGIITVSAQAHSFFPVSSRECSRARTRGR